MNETIGVKGGRNDRRRTLLITKKMKKRLEEYQKEQKLKELEKKVKLQQKLVFLAAVPIAALGQVYLTLTHDNLRKKELALKEAIDLLEKENLFSEKDTEKIVTALKEGNVFALEDELLGKLGLSIEADKQVSELDLSQFVDKEVTQKVQNNVKQESEPQKEISVDTKAAILKVIEITLEEKQEQLLSQQENNETLITKPELLFEQDTITKQDPTKEIKKHSIATNDKEKESNNPETEQKLEKLKNHKIIDEYEKSLKEVRKDLRQLIFEYNLIVENVDETYESKEIEVLLDKLNEIIKKIEELKRKLNIPDIDKYDDNYLYTLIENYIEEFKNKNFVSDIKDSALYIMISEKLEELDTKKDKLNNKIETKKTKLELDEIRIEELKEKYYNFEQFNDNLLKFQQSQDMLLNDIKDKMDKATTITERVETQIQGMTRQSRRVLALTAASLMAPGARTARGIATTAATYLYFMRRLMRPQVTARRYKVINVTDYAKEIESSLSQLEDVSVLLTKTSKQIDATIKEIETQFKDYINHIPECKELLSNLEKIKDEISEKEYELQRIKEEQEKNLEKNNAKVKVRHYESPM